MFSLVRILTGSYAIWFFTSVFFIPPSILFWPHAAQYSSLQIIIADLDHQWPIYAIITTGVLSGLSLLLGWYRHISATVQWLALTLVLSHIPLVFEVHLDYWSWLLALFIFIPKGEPATPFHRVNSSWTIAPRYVWAYWFSLGASYSVSGISKLATAAWNSGEMLQAYFKMGMTLYGLSPFMSSLSPFFHKVFSCIVAWPETLALPLVLFPRTRGWIWFVLTMGQMQMVLFSRVNHISIMTLIFNILALDPHWIENIRTAVAQVKITTNTFRVRTPEDFQ